MHALQVQYEQRTIDANARLEWLAEDFNCDRVKLVKGNIRLRKQIEFMTHPGQEIVFTHDAYARAEAELAESRVCQAITEVIGEDDFEKKMRPMPVTERFAAELYFWWKRNQDIETQRIADELELRVQEKVIAVNKKVETLTEEELHSLMAFLGI